jgi:hypothetical protein
MSDITKDVETRELDVKEKNMYLNTFLIGMYFTNYGLFTDSVSSSAT